MVSRMGLLESLLQDRSESELEQIRLDIQQEINALALDLRRVHEILAKKRSARESHSPVSTLRDRILLVLDASDRPLAPKEIKRSLAEQTGPAHRMPVKDTRLYNILSRMARNGELLREGGLYGRPAPGRINMNALQELTENGNSEPLSTATPFQETASD